MSKLKSREEALSMITEGKVLMVGGFLGVGSPEGIIDGIVNKDVNKLTLIANDTAFTDKGVGKLITNKKLKKTIVSHIGTNPVTQKQMLAGELEVELVPQGTLAERIRCGGAGLGGFYTPTGVGTVVEENKEIKTIEGKKYILESPLWADIALIKAAIADEAGNLVYRRSAQNFNPLMAMAADLVIVEADEIVPIGDLDPDHIMTPGTLVDIVIKS